MNDGVERILSYLGRISFQVPAAQVTIGYLMGRPERARFVHQVREGRMLALVIAVHRRIEIPMAPWQGYIGGISVPDPFLWIEAARGYPGEDVAVRISTDDPRLLSMLEPMMADDAVRAARTEIEDRVKRLRLEVDQVLDIYNELRHLMTVDVERQSELSKFLGMAEGEMQHLGNELNALKERLGENPA